MYKTIKSGFLALSLLTMAGSVLAQQKINEGTAVFTVKYTLSEEMAQMESMLPKESKLKFKNSFMKSNMEQGPALITVITDKTTNTGLVLLDVPIAQMQYAVKMSKTDMEETKKGAPVFSDFTATGEKKVIATYNAEKYTHKDDKGTTYELWVTKDIELPDGLKEDDFKSIKGTPIVYSSFRNGMMSTFTLKSLKQESVGDISLTIPSGYQLKTMEDLKAMQGGSGQ